MRKLIAAINMSVDGYCDHTMVDADDELHQHYADLLENAGALLYGRKTFQLMEYWKTLLDKPSGNKSMDDFAVIIDKVPKIVFSHTLLELDWESARLAQKDLRTEALELKEQEGKNVYAGSPGIIASLSGMNLIDEYQLCVHPLIAGSGLVLFKNIQHKIRMKLTGTKALGSGAIVLYYEALK